MNIDIFNIEVTRKCNLKCKHCMRGDAQYIDIDVNKLHYFLTNNDITEIKLLNFVGGEPSLVVEKLYEIMYLLDELAIDVKSFFMYTNGKEINDDFIQFSLDMFLFCSKNTESAVIVSKSKWHDDYDKEGFDKLSVLKFVGTQTLVTEENIRYEGRAKDIIEKNETNIVIPHKYKLENDILSGAELVINVNGDIIPGCDFSYDRQEKVKLGDYKLKLGEYSW